MTFQPPPPPPEGQEPTAATPPPPPPAYGTSPGGNPHPRPGAGFDPKSVNPLDWGIMAAGLLAFIFSFVSYYSASASNGVASISQSWSAWHGFFGWFATLVALAASVVVALSIFAPQIRLNVPPRVFALIGYAVATLCTILAIFIIPIETGGAPVGISVDKGHGVGFWISLIVIIAGLVMSLMRFQQTGGQLPGALGNIPNIGAKGPGGQSNPGGTPPPPPSGPSPR